MGVAEGAAKRLVKKEEEEKGLAKVGYPLQT
jgi:hypothetical protein